MTDSKPVTFSDIRVAWREFTACPPLLLRVALGDEERFARRSQDEDRARLSPSGEVIKVSVLKESRTEVTVLLLLAAEKDNQRVRQGLLHRCAALAILAVRDAWLGRKARHGPQQAQKNATAHD